MMWSKLSKTCSIAVLVTEGKKRSDRLVGKAAVEIGRAMDRPFILNALRAIGREKVVSTQSDRPRERCK